MINKEYGSDFHLCLEDEFLQFGKETIFSDSKGFSLFFSGRSTIYSLLKFGIENSGWKKVYFPGYYCHEVVQFIQKLPIEINYYAFNPFLDTSETEINVEDRPDNVVINVFFFGLSGLNLSKYKNIIVIEDLTHNILAFKDSKADYCFGSLRKQLPLPCGGFCYSAAQKNLPGGQHSLKGEEIAWQKAAAMFFKREYLEGRFQQKEIFRNQFIEAEKKFEEEFTNSEMPGIAKAIFSQLNIEGILEAKKKNLKLAFSLLKENSKVIYHTALANENALGLLLKLTSFQDRERLKAFLISKNIFPAVLWPGQIEDRDIGIEKTVLFLHMDYRYNGEDIEYITNTLNQYLLNE